MLYKKNVIIIILILLSFVKLLEAANKNNPKNIILVNDNFTNQIIGNKIEILEDKEKKWKITDITSKKILNKFTLSNDKSPNFGFTTSSYWIKFTIKSNSIKSNNLILELAYPLMDHIELYIQKSDKNYKLNKTGYNFPFKQRDIKHRNFLFKLDVKPNESKTCYIRFENTDRMEMPLILWNNSSFQEKDHTEQFILGLYYGLLFVMFLYNFFLFISIKDKIYLYYIFYVFTFMLVILTQNGFIYEYFTPTSLEKYNHFIPSLVILTLITIIQFTDSFLNFKTFSQKFHKILFGIKVFLGFLVFIVLFIPNIISVQIASFLVICTFLIIIFSGIISLINNYRPAKFFLIAWTSLVIGAIVYILKVSAIIPNNLFTTYAVQVGSALEVTLLSFALGDRINQERRQKRIAEQELMKTQQREYETLQIANKKIQEAKNILALSEEKYRRLVEGTNDIIFTLDENFNFITVNNAIRTQLRANPESIISMKFIDIVYDDTLEDEKIESVAKQLVHKKLEQLVKDKQPVEFKTELVSPNSSDPKEMSVRFEYINIEGKNEIIGKASSILEDTLLKHFLAEKQTFSINNNLLTAEEITHRITRNLRRYIEQSEINFIRIALREILINAIEHGNLGISFEEKTDAISNDNYFEFLGRRQREPKNTGKRVHIEYLISNKKAVYKITDEGNGFDFNSMLQSDIDVLNQNMEAHGRGLKFAQEAFDVINFNKKGNQVLLIKNI